MTMKESPPCRASPCVAALLTAYLPRRTLLWMTPGDRGGWAVAEAARDRWTGLLLPLAPPHRACSPAPPHWQLCTLERTRVQARQGQQGRRPAAACLCRRRDRLTRRVWRQTDPAGWQHRPCARLRVPYVPWLTNSPRQRCRPKQGFKLCV